MIACLFSLGCATTAEKVEQCTAKGGQPSIHKRTEWLTSCDCDMPTTGIPSTQGSTIHMGTDSNGNQLYCGSREITRVRCSV